MHAALFAPTSPVRLPSRVRRLTYLAVALCVAALLAALGTVAVQATLVSADGAFAPSVDDGVIPEGTIVTLADDEVPAIARLDPALREALRQAEADAARRRARLRGDQRLAQPPNTSSGCSRTRSSSTRSEEVARQFVATPDRSSHVTGDAVDIAPVDAQFWLFEHGARYGICQTYANERWHFELATEPGGVCPGMKADAAS